MNNLVSNKDITDVTNRIKTDGICIIKNYIDSDTLSLDKIILETNYKKKYKYKNINFLMNFNKTFTKLVCIFHGGRCGAQLPIFRGYNYFFKDTIVLSISDPLYSIYNDINIGWYLDTIKYKITEPITEIINYIQNRSKVNKTLFVAQCSGSLFAVKMGSILNANVLITNHHLILKSKEYTYHHWDNKSIINGTFLRSNKFKTKFLHKALKDDNNELLYNDELDVRNIIKKYGLPKTIYAYTHEKDYTAISSDLLKEYINKNNKINIKFFNFIKHNTPCKSPHHCPLPNNIRLEVYIKKILECI